MTKDNPIAAKFLTGSIAKHIILMTLSASAGLIGVFIVDLMDLYFLSLLGESELAAAVGYAGTITFFTMSVSIGFSIATGIVTARLLGEGKSALAKSKFVSALCLAVVTTFVLIAVLMPNFGALLTLLGASGKTHVFALQYLNIVIPALPFLVMAMCIGAALRGLGSGKNAMYITLGGALVNGILDPILIFGLDMGVEGAALASAIARFSMFLIGFYFLQSRYQFFVKVSPRTVMSNMPELLKLAVPAIMTNQATPFANAYMVMAIAQYGDSAVAGFAIIGRLSPVAFALVFALSGAIGPVVGQNFGGKAYDRIRHAVYFSYLFVAGYVVAVWLLMMLLLPWLVSIFNASGEAAALLSLFVDLVSLSFIFTGWLFVGNAVFNNLGKPLYSTAMNWLKATLGTIPFVYVGSLMMQAEGVLLGQAVGNVLFGIVSVLVVRHFLNRKLQS